MWKVDFIWLLYEGGCNTNLWMQYVLLSSTTLYCNFLFLEFVPDTAGHPHKISQPAASQTWDHTMQKSYSAELQMPEKGLNYRTVEISCSLSAWHLKMPLSIAWTEQPPIPLGLLVRVPQKNPGTTWKNTDKSPRRFVTITRSLMSDNTKNKGTGKWMH